MKRIIFFLCCFIFSCSDYCTAQVSTFWFYLDHAPNNRTDFKSISAFGTTNGGLKLGSILPPVNAPGTSLFSDPRIIAITRNGTRGIAIMIGDLGTERHDFWGAIAYAAKAPNGGFMDWQIANRYHLELALKNYWFREALKNADRSTFWVNEFTGKNGTHRTLLFDSATLEFRSTNDLKAKYANKFFIVRSW